MKTIVQLSNFSITLNRFDNNETVTLCYNTPVTVDDDTANFAINLKCSGVDENGVQLFDENQNILMSNIVIVE